MIVKIWGSKNGGGGRNISVSPPFLWQHVAALRLDVTLVQCSETAVKSWGRPDLRTQEPPRSHQLAFFRLTQAALAWTRTESSLTTFSTSRAGCKSRNRITAVNADSRHSLGMPCQ